MQRDNITDVVTLLIRELDIHVTDKGIKEETSKHPNHTSLLAISEILNYWLIPNAAYELKFEELLSVPVPFIAYASGKFVLVKEISLNEVVVFEQLKKKQILKANEFEKNYSGAILIAEKDNDSGEPDFQIKRTIELIEQWRQPLVYSLMFCLILACSLNRVPVYVNFDIPAFSIFILKVCGLITTILLLIQSFDSHNPLVQRLCGNKSNSNTDCNAILSSPSANVFNGLSWSEVGFFYFAGTLLMFMLNYGRPGTITILAILNVLSLPYTFYSIYYQWFVAKKWCLFCCTVQAILWLEFFAMAFASKSDFSFPEKSEWINLIFELVIFILIWIYIKPFFQQKQKVQILTEQLRNFKFNSELFNKLLKDEPRYALINESSSIVIGNPDAVNVITIVSNPYCDPCAIAHKKLDEWIDRRDDVKLQIIFTNHDSRQVEIANHLMALYISQTKDTLKNALSTWFLQKKKSYDKWSKSYPVNLQFDFTKSFKTQQEWIKIVNISATPTILINGRKLPSNYQPEDINYFI